MDHLQRMICEDSVQEANRKNGVYGEQGMCWGSADKCAEKHIDQENIRSHEITIQYRIVKKAENSLFV